MRYIIQTHVLASMLILASCSQMPDVIYRSTSPDSSAKIQLVTFLRYPTHPREIAELQLSTKLGNQVIKNWETSTLDMSPCFVAGAWSEDSSKVIVLFRNCYALGEVVVFDVRSSAAIEASEMKPLLAAEIRSEYALPDSISDPITWALESNEATQLFSKRRAY